METEDTCVCVNADPMQQLRHEVCAHVFLHLQPDVGIPR